MSRIVRLDNTRRRAVALDLDGTLLDSARRIGHRTIEAIRAASETGWILILSTARPARAVRGVVPDWFGAFYWAICNGAWVVRGGQLLRRVEMPARLWRPVTQALDGLGLRFMIEAGDKLFSNGEIPQNFMGERYPVRCLGTVPVCKIIVWTSQPGEAERALAVLPRACRGVVTDQGALVQVMRRGCDKLHAVRFVLRRERLRLEETVAFGDDANDVDLVARAGCGVAMANAVDGLKAVASHVTLSNDEEGVAAFLERLLDRGP